MECTVQPGSFILVIWASFLGETWVGQSVSLLDFAVLGCVIMSVVGLSHTKEENIYPWIPAMARKDWCYYQVNTKNKVKQLGSELNLNLNLLCPKLRGNFFNRQSWADNVIKQNKESYSDSMGILLFEHGFLSLNTFSATNNHKLKQPFT